ncbi:SRPBCC domain-containing protein [Qipengyuania sp. 6B39]|uniref:SRPBCC domain-containing protein n=1 Tax=Qipengyuania proteolytica TaxID=2867239 RepID=UPI001C89AD3E|nr:SRPBCC domain-containing protein [Qipengyuania proteolytica]MBX7494290.1 SRPBCC domain-containing protein [Qipengyuania proteolytica]
MPEIIYDTIEVTVQLHGRLQDVFGAFADPAKRSRWAAPSDTAAYLIETADFREGGLDIVRCGPVSDPVFTVATRYHRIVSDELIAATEEIRCLGNLLALSQNSIVFNDRASGQVECALTAQVMSFAGKNMAEDIKSGHEGSFEKLAAYLQSM